MVVLASPPIGSVTVTAPVPGTIINTVPPVSKLPPPVSRSCLLRIDAAPVADICVPAA